MKIKIWGARGSTPAPIRPEMIREKIVRAMLQVASLPKPQRDELLSALAGPPATDAAESAEGLAARRRAIDDYLNRLSPLAVGTAGGNTPCIEIQSGADLFIIDAGSGIRDLGHHLMNGPCGHGEGVIHLFFSHPHWDHIQGFPFFRPAFIPGNKIYIYSVHDIETALRRQQEFISFPISLDYMQATKIFTRIAPNEVQDFGDLRIRNTCNHHPGDAYSYRFEKGNKAFVYASDASYPDGKDMRPALNFFTDADLLIFDAQFTQRESDEKEDWGHSSSFVGMEMAQQANVKNLVLFHPDPTYTDDDLERILEDTLKFQQNQYPDMPPVQVMIAQEGQTFDLTPPQTAQVQKVPGSQAAILKPSGIFDEHVAAQLREQLADMVKNDATAQVVIDMTEVEMLQVAGLRGLVKLRKEHQSIPMALAGPSINVQQLIELAGYLDFFAIYSSVHAALNALKTRETLHLPGQILKNRYKVEQKIGEGHLGTVFNATDLQQNTPVAIKILSPSFSDTAIEQFLRQARQIVNLHHPNIVDVYDCDADRGISFMAEELVDSQTLREKIDATSGPLPFKIAFSVAQGVIRALDYAHSHGVIHGDLKPKNILLAGDQVKISDFGLGWLEGGKALINIDVPLQSARYLTPEQMQGQPIDTRTDLYIFGAILYEMFTGQSVFNGREPSPGEPSDAALPQPPRRINPKISRPLEHLILKLLNKDPAQRCGSARQVRQILNSMALAGSRERHDHGFTIHRSPQLQGRQPELEQILALWQQARQGRGQVVLLTGNAGAGKTRLLQELACNLNDATVLLGAGQPADKYPPYAAFTSALADYFDGTPPETAALNLGPVWQSVVDFVPSAGELLGGAPPIAKAPPESDVLTTLAQTTAARPWLLALDDLHLADSGTVKLLDHLIQLASGMSLLIVAGFETTAPENNPLLADLLEHARILENCTQISLEPLTEPDIRRLLHSIWAQSVPTDLISAIFKRTQGNPLFAEMIANNLIDEGVANWRDEKWHFGPVMDVGLPATVGETVGRRIKHLSRETRTLLNQAAVLGPVFSFTDLHELSDLSEWDALESITIALERQLLQATPGGDQLQFSHPLIQQVLVNTLSTLKQRLLHREAGEALERLHRNRRERVAGRLGHHYFRAGELERGLEYAILAGQQADALFANQTAQFWYTQALDIADQLDNVAPAQQFDLLLAREQVTHRLGRRAEQQADLLALAQLAQTLNDSTRQVQVHLRRARFEMAVGRVSEAVTEAQTGLIATRQTNTPHLESQILIQLAATALHLGQFDVAREHLYTAQNNLTDTDPAEADRLNGLGMLYRRLNNLTESEQYFRQAIKISRGVQNGAELAVYLSNLGQVLLHKGEFATAHATQRQALSVARITGFAGNQAQCLRRLAASQAMLARFGEARQTVDQAKLLHRNIEDEQGLAADLRVLATVQLAEQDYVAARDLLGQALEIFQYAKNKPEQLVTWLELAFALEGLGYIPRACHAYGQVLELATELNTPLGAIDAGAGQARCLLVNGKTEEAAQAIEHCLGRLDEPTPGQTLRHPVRFYLTAHQILRATGNTSNADAVLQTGRAVIEHAAAGLSESQKSAFFERIPEIKELLGKSAAPQPTDSPKH